MREQECRELYREAFSDPDTEFEDALFRHCFRYCKTLEGENGVISMLFAMPCTIRTKAAERDAVYVYAVATKKMERGKGYMHRLLAEIKKQYETVFLVPANEGLIGFYKDAGFREIAASSSEEAYAEVLPREGFAGLVSDWKEEREERFTAMLFSKVPCKAEGLRFPYRMG